jgi:hypothetical protein
VTWERSIIFDDDWFGAASPNSSEHVIVEGRWAYTPVMSDARGFSDMTNPYGLLRSPWNANKVPYVMRSKYVLGHNSDGYTTFPECTNFAAAITMGWVGDMLFMLNGALHGRVDTARCFVLFFYHPLLWSMHRRVTPFLFLFGDHALLWTMWTTRPARSG